MKNFKSRKFLLSLAAFLASLGASIGGIATDNKSLATVGMVCTVLSAAIYAGAEAYVDGASIKSKTESVNKTTITKTEAEK